MSQIPAPQVLLYRHDKTGAQLMSVANADENKTFGVTFRWVAAQQRALLGGSAARRVRAAGRSFSA